MKIIAQYIYKHKSGSWQVLYECTDSLYFTTDTGAFDQRDMSIVPIGILEAEQIINAINKTAPGTDTGKQC
jgi:hypothetical protein